MGNRQDLWNLLITRAGEWISRDNINFVGGSDAGRRMREIRSDIVASGQYRLEERRNSDGLLEFRLIQVPQDTPKTNMRFMWRCSKCDSHPADFMATQSTLDTRWRMGPCTYCRNKSATFRRAVP